MNHLKGLERFLPQHTFEYVCGLLTQYPVKLKIVRSRKTKLGDFSVVKQTGFCQITINNDLVPLNFLITLLHEIAHLYNWQKHGKTIQPHGKEWKTQYKALFLPILEHNWLEKKEHQLIENHLKNPKSSSCSDVELMRYFNQEQSIYLADLDIGASFTLNKKSFVIQRKLRTRYLCEEQSTGKRYYVNQMASITVDE